MIEIIKDERYPAGKPNIEQAFTHVPPLTGDFDAQKFLDNPELATHLELENLSVGEKRILLTELQKFRGSDTTGKWNTTHGEVVLALEKEFSTKKDLWVHVKDKPINQRR